MLLLFALQVGDLEEFDQLNENGIEDDCANEEDDDENGDAEYPESEAESLKETEYQVSESNNNNNNCGSCVNAAEQH